MELEELGDGTGLVDDVGVGIEDVDDDALGAGVMEVDTLGVGDPEDELLGPAVEVELGSMEAEADADALGSADTDMLAVGAKVTDDGIGNMVIMGSELVTGNMVGAGVKPLAIDVEVEGVGLVPTGREVALGSLIAAKAGASLTKGSILSEVKSKK